MNPSKDSSQIHLKMQRRGRVETAFQEQCLKVEALLCISLLIQGFRAWTVFTKITVKSNPTISPPSCRDPVSR